MKISVTDEGVLKVNEVVRGVETLSIDFLEEIVDLSLKGQVQYDITKNQIPIAVFFMQIQEGTKDDSQLFKELAKAKLTNDKLTKEIGEVENVYDTDNLSNPV